MRHPANESGNSDPDSPPEWSRNLLQQHGILVRERSSSTEVFCTDIRGGTLLLSLVHTAGPQPERDGHAELSVVDGSGIIRVRGVLQGAETVKVNGIPQDVLLFAADPETLRHINRRAAFRVDVTLKGELAAFEPDELHHLARTGGGSTDPGSQPALQQLSQLIAARKRPCIVRDLSVGGARVATDPPAARSGQQILMDLMLSREEIIRNLSGWVIQGSTGGGKGVFSAETRLRFDRLPAKVETRLSRLVNQVQLENLRRGVRNRR